MAQKFSEFYKDCREMLPDVFVIREPREDRWFYTEIRDDMIEMTEFYKDWIVKSYAIEENGKTIVNIYVDYPEGDPRANTTMPDQNQNKTTIEGTNPPELCEPWKDRFIEEYKTLKESYEKLHKTVVKYEAETLDFTPKCSLELLKKQANIMGQYLYILEMRAEIEKIDLD